MIVFIVWAACALSRLVYLPPKEERLDVLAANRVRRVLLNFFLKVIPFIY